MSELICSGELADELIDVRRAIHQYPELSFQEYATIELLKQKLESWGIAYNVIGETGLVVDIQGDYDGKAVAIRADLDALPIDEQADVPYRSQRPGIMHACGHDGHTAMLLGATRLLYENRSQIHGTVRCIFQPGEEMDGAAKDMIEKGVLQNPSIEAVFGIHLWPYLPYGTVGIKGGAMTASCDDFKITINGKSGHCARPHLAIDAIQVATQWMQEVQSLVRRKFSPTQSILIHIGTIHAGRANNVVADQAILEGTIRSLSTDLRKPIVQEMQELCHLLEKKWGVTIDFNMQWGAPAIHNNQVLTQRFVAALSQGYQPVPVERLTEPSMGADDFGYFSEQIPSLYIRLGIVKEDETYFDLHHPQFHFDDRIIARGAELYTLFALDLLTKERTT